MKIKEEKNKQREKAERLTVGLAVLIVLIALSTSFASAANYSIGMYVRSKSEIPLYTGWNGVAITLEHNETGDRNITIKKGWNLIGYSSTNEIAQQNSLFGGQTMSTAVLGRDIQNQFAFYDATAGNKKYKYAPLQDANLRLHKGYWVYSNLASDTNLTLLSANGSVQNETYRWADLMFTNGTVTLNVTNAIMQGWINPNIKYWDPTIGFGILLETESINSWQGYFIWTYKENITMLRQN